MEKNRRSIFILEGPDGVGKTTLAKELVRQTGGKYFHLRYRWPDKIFDYHTAIIRYAARSDVPVIIDRWWPSEAVYASCYRDGSPWPLQGRMADRVARKLGAVYIYCLPDSIEDAVRKHKKRQRIRYEMYSNIRLVTEMYWKLWYGDIEHKDSGNYVDFLIRNGGVHDKDDHMLYKISEWGHMLDLFVERAIDFAKIRQEQQWQPALKYDNWNVLGHLDKVKHLIVGEQVNSKHRELWWPFYESRACSLYLTQCLHKADIAEDGIMWMNAYSHNGHTSGLFKRFMEEKPKKIKIITLGGHAADAVDKLGHRTHAELPHPSYVKRFKKGNLTKELKDVIYQ